MTERFAFELGATDGCARTGAIRTPRGVVRTPAFMPVGTAATVKAMMPESVAATGADILLGNTYHLMLRPGAERVARLGGLHRFMNWERPILTDSGGFQVMSLSHLRQLSSQLRNFFEQRFESRCVNAGPATKRGEQTRLAFQFLQDFAPDVAATQDRENLHETVDGGPAAPRG